MNNLIQQLDEAKTKRNNFEIKVCKLNTKIKNLESQILLLCDHEWICQRERGIYEDRVYVCKHCSLQK